MPKPAGPERSPRRRPGEVERRREAPALPAAKGVAATASGRASRGSGVRVRASVLLGDLRGFTRLSSRLDPPQVVTLLGDFFTVMTDVAVANRARIERVIGDAMMLIYGADRPRRSDSVSAVRTALDMQRAFLALRNRWLKEGCAAAGRLGLGIGVATGEVVIGEVKSPPWDERATIGEPVNRAAQLCGAARMGDSFIDEATYSGAASALDGEVVFTSRQLAVRNRLSIAAYRVQRRRAGLHIVSRPAPIDPVCGLKLTSSALRRQRGGRLYFFCSQACARQFLDEGEKG